MPAALISRRCERTLKRNERSAVRICLLAAVALLAVAAPAQAITPTITEFSSGLTSADSPFDVTAGGDGAVWFTDRRASGSAIGRITTGGAITKFTTGLNPGARPFHIATGADGDLWFTDDGTTAAIGRINGTGHIDEFSTGLDPGAALTDIAAGPDGNLWFTDHGTTPAIGRITLSGAIHEFPLPSGSNPSGITAGPDGNLWFTDDSTPPAIGRITPSGTVHEFSSGLAADRHPAEIAPGSDGALWFTDQATPPAIGRITPAGAIREFSSGLGPTSNPFGIAEGPDGALWFADAVTPTGAIGRALTSGAISEFRSGLKGGSAPSGVTLGPDGNIWFGDTGAVPAVGMITTPPAVTTTGARATGSATAAILGLVDGHAQVTSIQVEYGVPGGSLASTRGRNIGTTIGPTHLTVALGKLRPNTTYVARFVATNPTDTSAGDFVTFTTAPPADRIIGMTLRPKTMVAASSGGPIRSARASRSAGALVSYTGTQPATTTFTIEHSVIGRRAGKNCVRRTRRNRTHKACTLFVTVGSFRHKDNPGRVRFRFTARIHGRKLVPGSYRLDAEPQSAGGIGRTVRKSFVVKLPARKHHKKH
jgi:streptogramin lyase